jgi:hypothetical protein
MTPPSQPSQPHGNVGLEGIIDVLLDSAVEAAVQTFLVLLMGGIALSIVGGLVEDMIPSPPPGLASAESKSHSSSPHWGSSFSQHKVPIVFTVIFIVQISRRFYGKRQQNQEPRRQSRMERVYHELSENWFSLIVGNAFGAMIGAMVLGWIQKFSLSQILWSWILHSIAPPLHELGQRIFGTSGTDAIGRWFSWYGENQFKFDFWLIYLASVCDDLGLPNLKTLARFAWRRFRKRGRPTPPSEVTQQPA